MIHVHEAALAAAKCKQAADDFASCFEVLKLPSLRARLHAAIDELAALTEQPAAPGRWVAFAEQEPPVSAALDDPSVTAPDCVLVTNTFGARDRMGRMSHVWFARPIRGRDGEWVAYDEAAGGLILGVTHWFDPFAAPQEPQQPNDEHVICPQCAHQFRAIPVQVQRLLTAAGYEPPFLAPAAPFPAPAVQPKAPLYDLLCDASDFAFDAGNRDLALRLNDALTERAAETERNFAAQLDAAGPVAVIDGTEVGPYPAGHLPKLTGGHS